MLPPARGYVNIGIASDGSAGFCSDSAKVTGIGSFYHTLLHFSKRQNRYIPQTLGMRLPTDNCDAIVPPPRSNLPTGLSAGMGRVCSGAGNRCDRRRAGWSAGATGLPRRPENCCRSAAPPAACFRRAARRTERSHRGGSRDDQRYDRAALGSRRATGWTASQRIAAASSGSGGDSLERPACG